MHNNFEWKFLREKSRRKNGPVNYQIEFTAGNDYLVRG